MDKPPDSNNPETQRPTRTVAELEAMIVNIDTEIVREGEKIDGRKLTYLTSTKDVLLKAMAKLKGESIDNKGTTDFS